VQKAEQSIAELEGKIALLEEQMMTPEGSSDPELFKNHARLKQELETWTETWMTASETLESMSE
jgi:ATP-binding cassette subfamily F protein 3